MDDEARTKFVSELEDAAARIRETRLREPITESPPRAIAAAVVFAAIWWFVSDRI
jgi:hypothetical protein